MTTRVKIDFISDISCPWCAIGLNSVERALERLGGEVEAELHFQPFELNPGMPAEGQDITEHIMQKYGMSEEQTERNRETIRARGAEAGFDFRMDKRSRIYNTFDAHRLLHWAEIEGGQPALKHALLRAYFTDGESPGDHAALVRAAARAGLDAERAGEVLSSGAYATEVREREKFYLDQGINSVPAIIIDDQYLIQGGQPAEVFERALREIAAGR